MDELTEQRLIQRFQGGDQSAYSELFATNERRVIHLALQIMRNEIDMVMTQIGCRSFEELDASYLWRNDLPNPRSVSSTCEM